MINQAVLRMAVRASNLRDDRGATTVEYGLLVALIALALVAAFTAFAGDITTWFGKLGDQAANNGKAP